MACFSALLRCVYIDRDRDLEVNGLYGTVRVPTRTEKLGRHFPVRKKEILNRLEKSGKTHKILEKSGNFRQMSFIIFSDI